MHIARKVHEAAAYLRGRGSGAPTRGIVVEGHMRGFSGELSRVNVLPFRKIPHYPLDVGDGDRAGAMLFGDLGGAATVVQEGLVRLCDGYLPGEAVFPLRVLAALGVRRAVLVAAGRALHPGLVPGRVMLIADHLNLTGATPLKGIRGAERTPFIEMREVGDEVRELAKAAAWEAAISLEEGVAALIAGPAWPTPAESRMLRGFGADAVSMALAPELAMAAHLGLGIAAFLVIGDGTPAWGKPHLDFCTSFLRRSPES